MYPICAASQRTGYNNKQRTMSETWSVSFFDHRDNSLLAVPKKELSIFLYTNALNGMIPPMNITYQIEERDGYLLYVAKGQPEDTDELVEYLRSVYTEAHNRGYRFGLVNETEVRMIFEVYDPVIMTDAIDSLELSKLGLTFAVVSPKFCHQLYEYFSAILRERSLNVRVFDSVEAAEEWIAEELRFAVFPDKTKMREE